MAIVRFCSSSRIRRSSLTISWAISSFKTSPLFPENTIAFTAGSSIVHVAPRGPVLIIIRNRAGYEGTAGGTNPPTVTGLIDHISWGVEPWDTAKADVEILVNIVLVRWPSFR